MRGRCRAQTATVLVWLVFFGWPAEAELRSSSASSADNALEWRIR
jgi:hypothetical protein